MSENKKKNTKDNKQKKMTIVRKWNFSFLCKRRNPRATKLLLWRPSATKGGVVVYHHP